MKLHPCLQIFRKLMHRKQLWAISSVTIVMLLIGCQKKENAEQMSETTFQQSTTNMSIMNLQIRTWTWVRTIYNNDTVKKPEVADAFTLTFSDDDQVEGTTDCNSFFGKVIVERHKIKFDEQMAMTRKYCEDSQELEFISMLQNVNSFFFNDNKELIMELKYDSGSMIFN